MIFQNWYASQRFFDALATLSKNPDFCDLGFQDTAYHPDSDPKISGNGHP
jgi:hypothetical protein